MLLQYIVLNYQENGTLYGQYVPIYCLNTEIHEKKPETYSEPCQISKVKLFAKIIDGWKPLSFLAKCSILDV